jgi:hypothetical protein
MPRHVGKRPHCRKRDIAGHPAGAAVRGALLSLAHATEEHAKG